MRCLKYSREALPLWLLFSQRGVFLCLKELEHLKLKSGLKKVVARELVPIINRG